MFCREMDGATQRPLLFPCGFFMAFSRSALASGFPTRESPHVAAGIGTKPVAATAVDIPVIITSGNKGSTANSSAWTVVVVSARSVDVCKCRVADPVAVVVVILSLCRICSDDCGDHGSNACNWSEEFHLNVVMCEGRPLGHIHYRRSHLEPHHPSKGFIQSLLSPIWVKGLRDQEYEDIIQKANTNKGKSTRIQLPILVCSYVLQKGILNLQPPAFSIQ